MPRFGINPKRPPPAVPEGPALTIFGGSREEVVISLDQLEALSRTEIVADFHCVTTWCVLGLHWSGWRLRDVWEQLIVSAFEDSFPATHLRAIGADGFRATLQLSDALGDDVLIADRLEHEPLDAAHGAPLRLVAPAHYGYKNVKHLTGLSVHLKPPRSSGRNIQHPRARIRLEERHATVPAWLLRWPYRLLIVPVALRGRNALTRSSG